MLFDSGLHIDTQSDPEGPLRLAGQVYDMEFQAGEEVATRLADLGGDAGEIRFLVNSHLHFDHPGGRERTAAERLARRAAGARVFYGHDPDFWTTVPQAPTSVC